MRLCKARSRIIGVRVGEVQINALNPDSNTVGVRFVLMRKDGTNAGQYTKESGFSAKTQQAMQDLFVAMEDDVLSEVFEVGDLSPETEDGKDDGLKMAPVKTLGGSMDKETKH